MAAKTVHVGLMGLGTVGFGTATILVKNQETMTCRTGLKFKIVRVLERDLDMAHAKLASLGLDPAVATDDIDAFMATPEMEIVTELIGGTTVAADYILKMLASGRNVVTANKDLMATRGGELLQAATDNGVDLRFEAAVAGGIPIIAALKESLKANEFISVMGIVNGTTNYILTKMHQEDVNFDDVLHEAQEKGYAEADPTGDVGGFDAARKIAIMASIAYNSRVTLNDVYIEGIEKIDQADIAAAHTLGYVIKLLAIAKEEDGMIEARVHPAMIPKNHPLASVNDTFNAVFVTGNAVGQTMFLGRGAGDLPTGSAVVGDICDVAFNIDHNVTGYHGCTCVYQKPIRKREDFISRFFMRMVVRDDPGVLAQISKCFGYCEVSLLSVVQYGYHNNEPDAADLVIVTHKVREGKFMAAQQALEKLECVHSIENIIRVED